MTLIARAGTSLPEIEAMLEAEGQSLAFEPPDLRGVLAAGAYRRLAERLPPMHRGRAVSEPARAGITFLACVLSMGRGGFCEMAGG